MKECGVNKIVLDLALGSLLPAALIFINTLIFSGTVQSLMEPPSQLSPSIFSVFVAATNASSRAKGGRQKSMHIKVFFRFKPGNYWEFLSTIFP